MSKLDEIKARLKVRADRIPHGVAVGRAIALNKMIYEVDNDVYTLIQMVETLQREIASYRAFKSSVDEALNSGDGTYKP